MLVRRNAESQGGAWGLANHYFPNVSEGSCKDSRVMGAVNFSRDKLRNQSVLAAGLKKHCGGTEVFALAYRLKFR